MQSLDPAILRRIKRWRESAEVFVDEAIHATPSKQQREVLRLISKERRITIRSGHGTGKDAVASWIIIWFLTTRPFAKVACTAPTARQLGDILWSELSKWIRKSIVSDEFVIQRDKIYHKHSPKEWWARAISPSVKASKDEQAETLAGLHGDHFLVVVDETSGVPDPMFIPLEGTLTQEDNKILLIGNMTKNKGYFYETHFHVEHSRPWRKLHWDSRESENVSKTYVEYMANKYGEGSNVFRIRVTGDPPLEDETVLIPLSWAEQCIGNEIIVAEDEPLFLGVDVARYGDDDSIILPRRGLIINPWETFHGTNTITLGGFINTTYSDLNADGIAIDEIGVGAGVCDWLSKRHLPGLYGINVSSASSDITKFDRLRDELWCTMRDRCMNGEYSFPAIKRPQDIESLGQQLANELSMPTYDVNSHGGIIVESKKAMRARGVASPNIADALGLTEYFHNSATKIWGKSASERRKRRSVHTMPAGHHSWMAV